MEFLGGRMKQLREKCGVNSLEAMRELLTASGNEQYCVYNKSTLSRAENGLAGDKTIKKWASAYCDVLGCSKQQKEQFLRGDKIAVPDTSALIKNPQLIDELSEEYKIVVIADIVNQEIEDLIDNTSYPASVIKKAKEIYKRIKYGKHIKTINYSGDKNISFEKKLISVTKAATKQFSCNADIITDDAVYQVKTDEISIVYLREYYATKQNLLDMREYVRIQNYYSNDYSSLNALNKDEINAYNEKGYTLIISTVLDHNHSFEEKKAKIKWLIQNGADVNKKDCNDKYFPPITHAVIEDDYQMIVFLLEECNANPNVASKSPYSTIEIRHKNEGNVPLMVAAWEGRVECLKALLSDDRTSINQQDSNGFTALIKACANGERECRDILIAAKADVSIVDHDGLTYADWYHYYLENGPLRERFKSENRIK